MIRTDKEKVIEDLRDRFQRKKILILTTYTGLNVAELTDLRRKLKETDTEYQIVKNTLAIKAGADTDVALIADRLKGPNAYVFNYSDPVEPAKVLIKFADGNKKLAINCAVLEGRVLEPEQIKALSKLPSREVLLSQLLSAFNGVPTSFVRVLSGVIGNFMNVLNAIKDQKEAQENT